MRAAKRGSSRSAISRRSRGRCRSSSSPHALRSPCPARSSNRSVSECSAIAAPPYWIKQDAADSDRKTQPEGEKSGINHDETTTRRKSRCVHRAVVVNALQPQALAIHLARLGRVAVELAPLAIDRGQRGGRVGLFLNGLAN